jgi:hypothetical protein
MPFWYQESDSLTECLHRKEAQNERIVHSFLKPGSVELRFESLAATFRFAPPTRERRGKVANLDKDDFVAGEVWLDNAADTFWSISSPPSPPKSSRYRIPPPPPKLDSFHDAHSSNNANTSEGDSSSISVSSFDYSHSLPLLVGKEAVELTCLSRRRASEWNSDRTYNDEHPDSDPGFFDDFKDVPDCGTIYPGQKSLEEVDDYFDHRRYNVHLLFPVYNLMMIERKHRVAERVGIGIIHVAVFWQAKPEWKYIVLA